MFFVDFSSKHERARKYGLPVEAVGKKGNCVCGQEVGVLSDSGREALLTVTFRVDTHKLK